MNGQGAVRSTSNAKKWLSKASIRGNLEAKELIKLL